MECRVCNHIPGLPERSRPAVSIAWGKENSCRYAGKWPLRTGLNVTLVAWIEQVWECGKMLKVYYDGACLVCDHEMNVYRKKDREGLITFVDISKPEFDAESEALDPEQIQKMLHVRMEDGSLHTGVDSFVAIWEALEIMKAVRMALNISAIKWFSDRAYLFFAEKIRPHLPKRRCGSESCQN